MCAEKLENASPSPSPRTGIFPWIVCGLGALFYCYEYLLRISPSVMTGQLMQTFRINAFALGDLIAFYYYVYTPMQLPVGVLMDRFGPRRLLVLACAVCAAGSYLFSTTTYAPMIGAARLLTGFGSAFAFVGVLKLASLWLPPNRFAMISGLATALGMVGAMVGDIIMAAVVNTHGWRATAAYTSYIGIGLALLILLIMRDGGEGSQNPCAMPPSTLKKLWPEIVILVRNPLIWLNGLIGCLLYLPTSAFAELWGVPYLASLGFSREAAATAISMIFLGWAIGGPLAGFVSDRIRRRCLPIIVGGIVATILMSVLLFVPALPKTWVYPLLLIFGIFSSVQVIVFAVGREISPGNLAGTAVAFTNMLVMVGGVIFQPLIGKLLVIHWNGTVLNGMPVYNVTDYKYALIVLPVALFLAILLTLPMRETHAKLGQE